MDISSASGIFGRLVEAWGDMMYKYAHRNDDDSHSTTVPADHGGGLRDGRAGAGGSGDDDEAIESNKRRVQIKRFQDTHDAHATPAQSREETAAVADIVTVTDSESQAHTQPQIHTQAQSMTRSRGRSRGRSQRMTEPALKDSYVEADDGNSVYVYLRVSVDGGKSFANSNLTFNYADIPVDPDAVGDSDSWFAQYEDIIIAGGLGIILLVGAMVCWCCVKNNQAASRGNGDIHSHNPHGRLLSQEYINSHDSP